MPIRLTRIVRTGLSRTVSTPAIAAQWTTCVAPRVSSTIRAEIENVALVEGEVRVVGELGAGQRVAVEVVDRDDLVVVDEPAGERRRDEAGAAGEQDAFSAQGHGGELSLNTVRALFCAALSLLLLGSACSGSGAAKDVAIDLRITVWPDGQGAGKPRRDWRLHCNPLGGNLPHGDRACFRLAMLSRPFVPVPAGAACAQVYGGPEVGHVVGTLAAADASTQSSSARTAARSPAGTRSTFSSAASVTGKTILFVGAGRHQRRSIQRARELGTGSSLSIATPMPPGSRRPTPARSSTSATSRRWSVRAARHAVDGVLTVSADRAVPVVAAVAEHLGLPGIGRATAT